MRFALALHTDDGVKYGVTVPDLPGCFSAGDSFDEAVEMAREAIDAHCELLAEKGLDIPAPGPLAQTLALGIGANTAPPLSIAIKACSR